MPTAARSSRPRVESQLEFKLLMELYDKASQLDPQAKKDKIIKFLHVSQPGVEKQVRWGYLFKSQNQAVWIVDALRWGLDQLRDGKHFMRTGPPPSSPIGFAGDIEKFQDGIVWDQIHGRVVRAGSNNPCQLFITRAFEVLTDVAPWLRVCQREQCRRLFLYERPKQIFCSEQCAQRVRMERFLASRGREKR